MKNHSTRLRIKIKKLLTVSTKDQVKEKLANDNDHYLYSLTFKSITLRSKSF